MSDEITSQRMTGVKTKRLDDEPETVFITFETELGNSYTFHMLASEMAQLAVVMRADARGPSH